MSIKNILSESEYKLILATEDDRIADLSEDKLLKLHRRTRRARNKHVVQYRRTGAAKVSAKGGRGQAKKANVKRAERAEVFEEALSRVSARLAVVAHEAAEELKAERLAAARAGSSGPSKDGKKGKGKVSSKGKDRVDGTRDKSGRKKYEASSIAQGQRRQAKRDKR
ncbi:hypothetical protein nbrc107696_01550 [Gordonia spumicola]|uniref:Uncharacterized protein n=1 Tax=Gordonia spumicola TaxID=589161 RepID=A0A7I9V2R6_9ACTN|nr:hypothetical protein [Gordonia spumicola]GED99708.1 hypothetical protein nbrc107696_01550 [Gordonia spumicola]